MLEDLKTAYLGAVAAADPTRIVKAQVRTGAIDDWLQDRERPQMIHVLALGKAAPRMLWGLVEASVPFRGIGATTRGQTKPLVDTFVWHVGGHPLPDAGSFAAGQAVLEWIDRLPAGAPVLVLMSGGASACIEAAPDPASLQQQHAEWWRQGLSTTDLNRLRGAASDIKDGRLGRRLRDSGHEVRVWTLCDLPPEDVRRVGSGPFDTDDIEHTLLADSSRLAEGAAQTLQGLGHEVFGWPRLSGPLDNALDDFMAAPLAPGQVLVAHGEVDLDVPADAPPGGRCAHAALLAARTGQWFFAGASDGIDGTTPDAAAWSADAIPEAEIACQQRRAHAVLSARAQTLRLGPTGTNLNDLWIRMPNTA